MNTGVYVITCTPTGKQYVGSAARSFAQRWRQHRYLLRRGLHHAPHLQNAWRKYGEDAFVFAPIVRCPPDQVIEHEQRLIDTMHPEFNTMRVAGSTVGFRFTEEQIEMLRGRPQSTSKRYEFRGEQLAVPEIAKRLQVTPAAIYTRLRAGGGVEPRATLDFTTPIDIGGEALLPRQIAEKFALPLTTVYSRLKRGWTGAALTEPRKRRGRNSEGA